MPEWAEHVTRSICKTCRAPCCTTMRAALDQEQSERRLSEFKGKYENVFLPFHFGSIPLLKRRNGACIFFDKDRRVCKIYNRRPGSCRAFFCGKGTRNNSAWKALLASEGS